MKISPDKTISFALFLITFAVNLSMPLFRPYAVLAGLNNGQTALILASYILGMLPCFIFLGGISDVVGRKPILLLSLLFAFSSDVLITIYPNVYALIVCRIFQGIGLGLSMGTGTAYLAEILKNKYTEAPIKAAQKASLATSFGFSGGAFITTTALLISYNYRPTTYFIGIFITFIGIILTLFLPKIPPIGGKITRFPYFPKGSFDINLGIAICWAATSIIIAIVPSQLANFGLKAYAGFGLVLVNWTGAFIQPLIRKNFKHENSFRWGIIITPIGFAMVVLGCYLGNLPVILLGAAVVGSSAYGFSYQGGLAIISNLGGVQRARAVAGFMFIGYLGFGIPAILIGYIADKIGIVGGLLVFEITITLLSIFLFFRTKKLAN